MSEAWDEFGQARDRLLLGLRKDCGIDILLEWLTDRVIDYHYWLLAASRLSGAKEEFLRKCNRRRVTIRAINALEALYCFWMGCQGLNCGARRGVRTMGAMTAYAENSRRANAPLLLCPECQQDNYEYWREMRQEYHSGLL